MENTILLERDQPFSQSILWALQREYFEKEGVLAWSGQVPFYITSNPFIANSYAQVIIRYIQDQLRLGADPKQPFYVVELATGSGQFSYLCLNKLLQLKAELKLDVTIQYIMTDFTENNLRFWEEHFLFKPFVERGELDFAVFDVEESESLHLLHQKVELQAGDMANPAILLANYTFDTVKHDVFHVQEGKLSEALISVSAPEHCLENGKPKKLTNDLRTSFRYQELDKAYYGDAVLDDILQEYTQSLDTASFLFPIGSFHGLEVMRKLTKDRFMVIATDKGYSRLEEIEGRHDPAVTFHGSFSMSVNFHAIEQYFNKIGGAAVNQDPSDAIKTCVYQVGQAMDDLVETQQAIEKCVVGFGPGDYFTFHRMFREMSSFTLAQLLSQLRTCQWDPYVFSVHARKINDELPQAPINIIQGFLAGVDKMEQNIYPMPGAEDHYLNIGITLHAVQQYDRAIGFYQSSLKYYGQTFSALFNQGICLYMIGQYAEAQTCFEQVVEHYPDKKEDAQEWLEHLQDVM